MQKHELVNLIIARTPGTTDDLNRLRRELQIKTVAELDEIVDQQNLTQIRAEAARAVEQNPRVVEAERQAREKFEDLQFSRIFGTPVNGRVAVDNQANRSIIRAWINFDEQISPTWFKQVFEENPGLAKSLTWQSADVLDPKKRQQAAVAQEESDRETFEAFAKSNGFSEVTANFHLAKSVLGSGFDQGALAQAVQSGLLQLAPASEEELAERAEERQAWLANEASPEQLREAAATEAEQGRVQFQQQEAAERFAARERADKAAGYPPLPTHNLETGEAINAVYLNRLSNVDRPKFKALLIRYGNFQLTQRLREIS